MIFLFIVLFSLADFRTTNRNGAAFTVLCFPICHSYQRCPRKDLFCTLRKVTHTIMPGSTMKYGTCYHPILRPDIIFLLNGRQFIVWRTEARIEDSCSGSHFLLVSLLNLLLYCRSRCTLGRPLSGIWSKLWKSQ